MYVSDLLLGQLLKTWSRRWYMLWSCKSSSKQCVSYRC